MRWFVSFALALSVAGALCFGGWHGDDWPVRATETIRKTFPLTGSPNRVMIDNVHGNVRATGYNGSEVRITARKTVRSETEVDAQKAGAEVKLELSSEPGSVSIYYDAPWRCDHGRSGCNDDHHERFYNVAFDIDVEVPSSARVVASTINGGELRLDGISGDFEAHNINGAVSLTGMGGAGEAHTINGPVSVHFVKSPGGPCSFKTINGSIDTYFPSDLSADLSFKTLHGDLFTDFDLVLNPSSVVPAGDQHGPGFVYRSNRNRRARAGIGGPQLSFETLNGDIRLHRIP